MTRVVVHIDRLVMKGFGLEDRQRVAASVRDRLAHQFGDPQALRQLREAGDVPRMRLRALAPGKETKT